MGVKLGFSHLGKNINWWCLRTVLRRIFGFNTEEVTGG
jgi:hypothetical protein